jgi:hypothetical protein
LVLYCRVVQTAWRVGKCESEGDRLMNGGDLIWGDYLRLWRSIERVCFAAKAP